jgi:hypothetical protein
MLDLEAELDAVIAALTREGVEYAVCGGLAMAIHGKPRATIDIDLLIKPEDEERVYAAVERLGFRFKAKPMHFAGGTMEIRRVTKIDSDGEALMLDLLLVTPAYSHVWQSRQTVAWRKHLVSVVSREGLIALKSSRSSAQDLADIERLGSDE